MMNQWDEVFVLNGLPFLVVNWSDLPKPVRVRDNIHVPFILQVGEARSGLSTPLATSV